MSVLVLVTAGMVVMVVAGFGDVVLQIAFSELIEVGLQPASA